MEARAFDWNQDVIRIDVSGVVEVPEMLALDGDMRGQLELVVGRALLEQGLLEQASTTLIRAAGSLTEPASKAQAVTQLLLLARALGRRQDMVDAPERAELVLRLAVQLAPEQALSTLAQHVQRQDCLVEARDLWHEAVRLQPQVSSNYLGLARVFEKLGQPQQALSAYLQLVDAAPSAASYLLVAQRLEDLASALPETHPARTVKIALLGNATLDHLQSYVNVECYRAGLRPALYQGGFDQYTQEILNPESNLYAFSPDVVVCAIHASRLFPELHQFPFDLSVQERRDAIDAGVGTLRNLLDELTSRTSALILLHNMVSPQYPALGIADWRDELGQTELFGFMNATIAQLARSRYKNIYVIDEDRIQARSGKSEATDTRLWLTSRMGWSHQVLEGLAKEYLRYLKPYKGLTRKCIVLDLDNTLWGGVVGEDGVGGIQLGPDAPGNAFVSFQRELERLWRQGILLAICSKNNVDDVVPVFETHPSMVLRLSHFAACRINWESKADNIRAIARELNLGLDSLVFVDDNPVERVRLRAELPEVLTPELPSDPAYYRGALLELDVFGSLGLTEEDRRRNQLYAEQKARREYETDRRAGSNTLEEYLAELAMLVEIEPANDHTLPRIAQLTNKTNQFNLTTKRYTEAQIGDMLARGCQVYSMRVTDRFGDNGIVGVAIIDPSYRDTWTLDTFLLSCRVMGRGVEAALLASLVERARHRGVQRLRGWFVPTAKNAPVKDLYRHHGFRLAEQCGDGGELWELDVTEALMHTPEWLSVRAPALAS